MDFRRSKTPRSTQFVRPNGTLAVNSYLDPVNARICLSRSNQGEYESNRHEEIPREQIQRSRCRACTI